MMEAASPANAEKPVVLLGITGSIAAYKAADLASLMVKRDWDVHVVMTHGAQQFITPLTLQTLSRNPVLISVFEDASDWAPAHIELADKARAFVVAPATANIIAELAHGLASNPITEIALAIRAPLVIAPAMNGKMWAHPATQANVETLRGRGARFVGPEETGMLACGYEGAGRLASAGRILAAAAEIIDVSP